MQKWKWGEENVYYSDGEQTHWSRWTFGKRYLNFCSHHNRREIKPPRWTSALGRSLSFRNKNVDYLGMLLRFWGWKAEGQRHTCGNAIDSVLISTNQTEKEKKPKTIHHSVITILCHHMLWDVRSSLFSFLAHIEVLALSHLSSQPKHRAFNGCSEGVSDTFGVAVCGTNQVSNECNYMEHVRLKRITISLLF